MRMGKRVYTEIDRALARLTGEVMRAQRRAMSREQPTKITCTEIGEAMRVSRNTVQSWESGARLPTIEQFAEYARCVGVTARTLIALVDTVAVSRGMMTAGRS